MAGMMSQMERALIDEGLVTEDQLAVARESRKALGGSLEQILIEKRFVTEEQLLKALANKMNTSFLSLSRYKIDPAVVKLLPVTLAKKYRAIPLFKIENKVTIATSNPMNLEGLDDIRRALNADIEAFLALDSDIERAIREYYRGKGLSEMAVDAKVEIVGREEDDAIFDTPIEKIEREASGKQVVSTVNNILSQAFEDRASDIHMEPTRDGVNVRLRIDGVLEELAVLPKTMHLPIISRIKIMGGMDIAERRVPQDGRVRLRIGDEEIDLRIATYPTMFGEAAAIRLLSKRQLMTLEELGFAERDLKTFEELILKPHGILLVTGPTGSGKTTTLYASLMRINSKDKHILSVEDPIENEIPGVDQQQVNVKAGMTFAASLRAMLRQDPDVIMVGEIRDQETADIASRAAMTGHLVFSTLHTNTAIGAVPRLVDLGVEPFLVSSTLIGSMAQRLVRKVCPKCREEVPLDDKQKRKLESHAGIEKTFTGKGCKHCRKTGFSGRIGVFEIIPVVDDLRGLIENKATETMIREKATELGYHTLLDDGLMKVKEGVTTLDEVLRVVEG